MQSEKWCPSCSTLLPIEKFYVYKNGNIEGNCKVCKLRICNAYRSTPQGTLRAAWRSMFNRCDDPGHKFYSHYGGRGIGICQEWRDSFDAFYAWSLANGWEKGLQLDRKQNDAGYSPDNCRWTTHTQNQRNRNFKERSSRYVGVCKGYKGKWRAYYSDGQKQIKIGEFGTEEEAARERDRVAGPLGYRLNFPQYSAE